MISTPCYKGQGLGNFLANYVTVRSIALDRGYDFGVQFPENFKGQNFMNLDMGLPVVNGLTIIEGQTPDRLPDGIITYYREKMIGQGDYDQGVTLIDDGTLIHGNLQGVDYFKHNKDKVREWLSVETLDMPEELCVINFRGGEYQWVKEFFLPQSYWDQAIDEMKKTNPNMRFQVHTDDAITARRFFPSFEIIQDIGLNWRSVRFAHYLVLSNSSFAILPAFLNENVKRVIAPWGFGRFNEGYWLLDQNYVEGWDYLDREGNLRKTK